MDRIVHHIEQNVLITIQWTYQDQHMVRVIRVYIEIEDDIYDFIGRMMRPGLMVLPICETPKTVLTYLMNTINVTDLNRQAGGCCS